MLINYEPRLHYFGEWWKQLFGESEGKDGKGLFPAAADFQLIYTQWDNIFKMEEESYLKQQY